MNRRTRNHGRGPFERRRTAGLVLALAAACGVLLPVYAPFVSSSYAELLPGHAHVYLSGTLHGHGHSYSVEGVGGGDTTGPDGGVLALPAVGDGGGTTVLIVAMVFLVAMAARLTAPPLLRGHGAAAVPVPWGFQTPPGTPPPRLLPAR